MGVYREPEGGSSGAERGGSAGAEERTCMVCLEAFTVGEDLRILPCLHRYHKNCIDPWLARNRHCPVCKHDVTVRACWFRPFLCDRQSCTHLIEIIDPQDGSFDESPRFLALNDVLQNQRT